MAEQDGKLTRQHTEGDKTQSTNEVCASSPDECKQANHDLTAKQTQDSALVNNQDKNNSDENIEKADDKSKSGENIRKADDKNNSDENIEKADDKNNSDENIEKADDKNNSDENIKKADDKSNSDENIEKADDKTYNQAPGPEDPNQDDRKDDDKKPDLPPEGTDTHVTHQLTASPMENEEEELHVQKNNAETIGNIIKETTEPMAPVSSSASANSENGINMEQAGDKKDEWNEGMEALGSTKQDDQVDQPKPEHTDPDAGGDSVSQSASTTGEAENDKKEVIEDETKPVETIGPASQTAEPAVPEATGILAGIKIYLIALILVPAVALLVKHLLDTETPPQIDVSRQVGIFLKQLEEVKTQFPNQRAELWKRSRIHLQRHLQADQPTEPVSLILTAGLRAERTLHCLASSLASAFSSALNASVLPIDGASLANQDSDEVKLEIDNRLQTAFEGDKPVAVIHRFEELPPGSTLIFYRYCDHENAAFKKTFLIFTVLLGEEEAIPAEIHLSTVEEMVDDHLRNKFLTHDHPVSFDRMDRDKYGGLWSRISHLILPVASEEGFERKGCNIDLF